MKDLYRRGGGAHFHFLLHERIGNAVEVLPELNVIVDVDADRLPLAILIPFGGQRP
jgi:hypothetical protein